ncbi:NAD(P)-dependent oxidoreductase [Agromyces seonyuensis]|uniref:NAD(P)H-binding protein n=1 Tax=Agromyces seonyuensis TaxID=2662446 RepID=A0A6I4NV60_9MICO|nr:NAD(P)-binding oxidoreductase [Agromyces seonyuensis]MWB98190.1 NAD(P)H-binding protein [Agromyces seonyuensis]
MDTIVIGASSGTGRAVVDALLGRGHRVTAVSRRATERIAPREGLTVVDADATDPAALDRLLPGHDAIVLTVGITEPPMRVRLRGPKATTLDVRSRATAAVLDAARRAGIRRIVVQSSYGVGQSRDKLGFVNRLYFALLLKPQIFDTEVQEGMLRGSGLDWTIVQPVFLTDEPGEERFTATDGRIRGHSVSRRAVAQLHAELAESTDLVHESVAVSG